MSNTSIAVVGGGAAGMMAVATIIEQHSDTRVTLFERNRRLGAKVAISGGGRCNLTTGITDPRQALAAYPRGGRWLRHAMHSFPPRAVVDWFQAHGVPCKTEDDLRVFPRSDRGQDVVDVFVRLFRERGVDLRLDNRVTAIRRDEHGFWTATAAGEQGPFPRLILTTGGSAYSHTGSRGDGFRFARELGHTVTPLHPSLSALVVREPWVRDLAGLSLVRATLTLRPVQGGKALAQFSGPMIFTHRGVSGPAVFALCALAAAEPLTEAQPARLEISLLPDQHAESADALLAERFAALGGRELVNVLDTLLPRSLCPLLCDLAGADPATRAARVDRASRRRLAALLVALPLTVTGRRPGDEFVTAGGVSTEEVDPRTMASRVVPGLYLAGEVLNVDGFTGGFNLQSAWATGRLAGLAAGTA